MVYTQGLLTGFKFLNSAWSLLNTRMHGSRKSTGAAASRARAFCGAQSGIIEPRTGDHSERTLKLHNPPESQTAGHGAGHSLAASVGLHPEGLRRESLALAGLMEPE